MVAVLAALVVWPTVAVAQEPVPVPEAETEPETEPEAGAETEAGRTACADAAAVFDLLCRSYELLKERYVDDVPDEDLAVAAASGSARGRAGPARRAR